MANLNRVVIIGRLTRDPELRFTPSGIPVAKFGVAVNRRRTNSDGEKVEDTSFFNVVVWRKLAELCADYLSKGRTVAIDGRLQSRSWETQDGQKRSTVEIVADNVQFLDRKEATETTIPSEETDLDMQVSSKDENVTSDEEAPF